MAETRPCRIRRFLAAIHPESGSVRMMEMMRTLALIATFVHGFKADICSYCSCDRHAKSVTCNSPTLLIRTVSLLPWVEELHFVDLNLPYPPHFLYHPPLRVLRVNRCRLQAITAQALLSLPNLEVLNLADNHLDALPASVLRSLKHLQVLNLSRNRFANLTQVQPILADGVVLKQFDLSGNPLTLSTTSASLPLSQRIHLSEANLDFVNASAIIFHPSTTCPMDVACRILPLKPQQLSKLTAVDFSGNDRLRIDISALNAFTNVTRLDFSYTHLPKEFTKWLQDYSRAVWLNLSHAVLHLEDDNWSFCGKELKTLDLSALHLKRLNLHKQCVLSTMIARENLLESALLETPTLESLHLDRNLITDWLTLPPGMALDRLRALTVSSNLLSSLPAHALSQFPNLQHLDVSRNQISEIDHLAFPTLGMQLVSVDLSFNQLSILPHPVLPSLLYLDVSSNNLVTLDAALFAGLPQLQHLKLANNPQIFSRCEKTCWSDHLDELTTLIDLDLSYCDLSRVLHLAHLRSLRTLLLRGNQIVDVNAAELPPRVTTLDLGENRLHFTRNFSRLNALRDLRVDTNPLRCDCSLHDIVPHLLNQSQIGDPQLYYCFSGSWQYPLLPYLTGVSPCRESSQDFIPLLISSFTFSIIVICLLLLAVAGYKHYLPLVGHAYKRLATEAPTRL